MTEKKPNNLKDILSALKNKDNLIILLEIIVIAIAAGLIFKPAKDEIKTREISPKM